MIDQLVFGCATISSLPSRKAAFALLDTALQVGIRHFDTARCYGQGYSERVLGEFLRANQPDVLITTKVGLGPTRRARVPTWLALPANHYRKRLAGERSVPVPEQPRSEDGGGLIDYPTSSLGLDYVRTSVEESLRCLGLSHVEVLLLHESLPQGLDAEALDHLRRLRSDGVVGTLGVGTDTRVIEAHYRGHPDFTILQYGGSLGNDGMSLRSRFPDMVHYQHSFLKHLGSRSGAEALAEAVRRNPGGKIIFSTRSPQRIFDNTSLLR